MRAPEDGRVEHPGELEVGRVASLAAGADVPVDARRRLPDERARPLGPLVERVLLDEDPLLGVAALDFFLGADQASDRIASRIFG